MEIDETKPASIVAPMAPQRLDSRARTFSALQEAREKSATFEVVSITVGQGSQIVALNVGEIVVDADFIENILTKVLEKFKPDTPINMTFRKAHFNSGHDLKVFAEKLGIDLQSGDIEQ